MNVYHNSDTDGKYPVPTYKDPYGETLNPTDIVLDNNGRAVVYVNNDFCYRLEVFDKDKNLLWTTDNIQPINGIAIDGTYVFSIIGDEYISVNSERVGQQVNYSLSLSNDSKGAIDGFYDSTSGNQALYNAIQTEIQNRSDNDNRIYNTLNGAITNVQGSLISETMNRQMADNELRTQISAAKTEVKNVDGTISVQASTATDGHTIYTIAGVEQVPNVSVQSSDHSITVTETTQDNNKIFDLSVNTSSSEWVETSSVLQSLTPHTGVPIALTKDNGNMTVSANSVKSLNGLYHSSIRIDYTQTTASFQYTDLTLEILKGSTLFKSFDCVIDTSKQGVVQTFVINFDFEMNGEDYKVQYRTGGLSGGMTFKNYIHKISAGVGSSGGAFDNPILMSVFLMNENGNVGFTGSHWAGDGSWNTYGINITTRYYKVSSLCGGEISAVKFWNYNGNGKIRVCVMNADGSIKCQSDWREITNTGEISLPMTAETGQTCVIERNTDYWIGICCYGLQLVSYNKTSTSFDSSSLRYAVCIRNGGQFPQSGTGWDNPNTDAVNSIPTEIPCVYMVATN